MTYEALQALVLCICSGIKGDKEDKVECIVKYANCSIKDDSSIKKLEDFKKTCNFTVGQERCYRGN